jgi:hypothetical protein
MLVRGVPDPQSADNDLDFFFFIDFLVEPRDTFDPLFISIIDLCMYTLCEFYMKSFCRYFFSKQMFLCKEKEPELTCYLFMAPLESLIGGT